MFETGGGQNNVPKKEPCHDIILSIMNTKTVYGLQNDFDVDAEPERHENIVTWKKHTPADLQKPVSSSLINSNVKRTSNVEDLLLDKRMVMVDYQNKKIQEEIKTMKRERELKVELLELQLKVEKEKLKQLQFRL
ncbi:hypothetical protein RI129_012753 [Pyrocoelia pectoralis]|uniref:Uncharacterized protein n=1 Tax=Pyrocoelia pectoralis TaxID=417401 RepID=A0AAN7V018_9COLE